MVISTPEKERALADLHRISVSLDRIADALEDIDAALERAFPERSNRQAFTGARRFTSFQDQTEESTKE